MGFLAVVMRNRIVNFAAIALVHFQISSANRPVCNTEECKELANIYRRNMNPSINPCENFYEYACHGWQEHYKNSQLYSYWSTDDQMKREMYNDIKRLLEKMGQPRERELQQLQAIYKACTNAGQLSKTEPAKLSNLIYNINTWPLLHLSQKRPSLVIPCWITEKHYLRLAGESAFFDYKIRADESDSNKLIIELLKPATPYGIIEHRSDWSLQELKNYRDFLFLVIKAVAPNAATLQRNVVDDDLDDLMLFRKKLNNIIHESTSKVEVPVKSKIEQFQHWYDLEVHSRESAKMNWLELIRAIYKIPENRYSPTITASSEIIVRRTYFNKLAKLMGATNIRVLENHMHLYFVEKHILIDPTMRRKLMLSFDDEKGTGKFILDVPKWRKCIENIHMKETLEQLYLKEYFPKEKEADVTKMLQETKRLLLQQITNSNWLNTLTKTNSKGKVHVLRNVVGYSKYQDNDPLDPLDTDIYYEPQHNTISVSASYLTSPLYGKTFPYAIDYGATISSFGHELYHGFDKDGIRFNKQGGTPFWSKEMIDQYNKQLVCFEDQFSRYKSVMLNNLGIRESTTESTITEDFADAMGLKLAYDGFKEKFRENKAVCPTLPGFENYSCHKLFFLAYANVHCTHITQGLKKKQLRTENHSLAEIRVNVPVSNIHDFKNAFGCKPNSPLVQIKRCNIWRI